MGGLSRRKTATGSASVLGPVEARTGRGKSTQETATTDSARQQRVTLPIYGLGCGGGGVLTIERALARTPGVVRAYVNPATEMAYVEYDPAVCTLEELCAVVRSRGFRAGEPSIR